MPRRFHDRIHAGRELAAQLKDFAGRGNAMVLALPRGGVPVAYAVATELGLPLDVFLVRKLGAPAQPELAMGALAPGGVRVLNAEVVRELGITEQQIAAVTAKEEEELRRRDLAFRDGASPADVRGKSVILVDDGLATGSTMRAAVAALRKAEPKQIVIAVPVGAGGTCDLLRSDADHVICLTTPEHFYAVGEWYDEFDQTTDDEVRDLLRRARQPAPPA